MSLNSVTESNAKEKQPIKLRLFVLKELAHSSELADLLLKQLTLNGCVGLLEDAWVAVREQDARESGYLMSSQVTGNALRTPQREQPRLLRLLCLALLIARLLLNFELGVVQGTDLLWVVYPKYKSQKQKKRKINKQTRSKIAPWKTVVLLSTVGWI